MFDDPQFRALLEAAPDAMIIVDSRGRMVLVNGEAERLFGFSRRDVLGEPIEVLVPEHLRRAHSAHRDSYFRAPGRRPMGMGLELFGRRKDGSEFPVEISLSPLTAPGGPFIICAIRDITERKAAASERERLVRERTAQEAANRLKDEFVAMVSHELRTPLNVILGNVFRLKSDGLEPDARTRILESLEWNARSLAMLVDDLLDVSRIATGKLHLDRAVVEIPAVIHRAIEQISPVASTKNVAVRMSIAPGLVVIGDPYRLQQVFSNLLSNAVRFTASGGAIHIIAQYEGTNARIDVSDNGVGFDPSFAPRLFEPFTQADTSFARAHGGLGLGLAIVRQLVELHGGTVEARSPGAGGGSTFSVHLPLRAPGPLD